MPQTRRSAQKRETIRIAAYRCFREAGYHETTVDAICGACGISKGSFYWHYASKQEIFVDILETWARQVTDAIFEQFEQAVLGEDFVASLSAALSREYHRGRAIAPLWLEFTLLARHDEELATALQKFYRRARLAIVEILRPVASARLDDDDLAAVAAMIFGAYTGILVQDMAGGSGADASRLTERFMIVLGRLL